METKNVIYELRTGKGMSQDELAEKLFVTRQAVSRWENGETVPNTETLKLLSKLFDVSINTLLGSPRQLVCQCCGMPLEEASLSREPDGAINEDYCNGATPTANLPIRTWTSSSTSARSTWRAINGLPGRCARIWRDSCRRSSIGRRRNKKIPVKKRAVRLAFSYLPREVLAGLERGLGRLAEPMARIVEARAVTGAVPRFSSSFHVSSQPRCGQRMSTANSVPSVWR